MGQAWFVPKITFGQPVAVCEVEVKAKKPSQKWLLVKQNVTTSKVKTKTKTKKKVIVLVDKNLEKTCVVDFRKCAFDQYLITDDLTLVHILLFNRLPALYFLFEKQQDEKVRKDVNLAQFVLLFELLAIQEETKDYKQDDMAIQSLQETELCFVLNNIPKWLTKHGFAFNLSLWSGCLNC